MARRCIFPRVVLAKLLVALWSEACEVAVVAVACGARRAVAAATLLRGEALGTVRQQHAQASLRIPRRKTQGCRER